MIKIFIIDCQADYRSLFTHHITTRWPDAVIKEYDPDTAGRLPDSFSGAGNDIILLGHSGKGGDSLDWLRQFSKISKFPPVIVLGDGGEQNIVAAIKAGAENYISWGLLSNHRLVEVVDLALGEQQQTDSTGSHNLSGGDMTQAGLPSLKRYDLRARLAERDISSVYLTREHETGRKLVVKVLRQMPDDGGETAFDRFLQEYELIAALDHPNVVKIHDLGVADDHAYIAMEFCSQGSLKRRIVGGLSPDQAYKHLCDIAGALNALHEKGIYHRDLKPTNVMFRKDDSLALIDFGLAKQARFKAEITGTGEIFGTPYYMSPEQGHGGVVDERGDIYSLGVIYYEMLTGNKPFEGSSAMAVIISHRQTPIPRLPESLVRYQPFVDKMMAKSPGDRFQSIQEVLAWVPVEATVTRLPVGKQDEL